MRGSQRRTHAPCCDACRRLAACPCTRRPRRQCAARRFRRRTRAPTRETACPTARGAPSLRGGQPAVRRTRDGERPRPSRTHPTTTTQSLHLPCSTSTRRHGATVSATQAQRADTHRKACPALGEAQWWSSPRERALSRPDWALIFHCQAPRFPQRRPDCAVRATASAARSRTHECAALREIVERRGVGHGWQQAWRFKHKQCVEVLRREVDARVHPQR